MENREKSRASSLRARLMKKRDARWCPRSRFSKTGSASRFPVASRLRLSRRIIHLAARQLARLLLRRSAGNTATGRPVGVSRISLPRSRTASVIYRGFPKLMTPARVSVRLAIFVRRNELQRTHLRRRDKLIKSQMLISMN